MRFFALVLVVSLVACGAPATPPTEAAAPSPTVDEPTKKDEPTKQAEAPSNDDKPLTDAVKKVVAEENAKPAIPDFDERFVGKWKIEQWGVRYEVQVVDGEIVITGEDYRNDEAFEVSNVSWTPPTLQVTFRMPSTDHTTHSVLRVLDDSRIEDRYTGGADGVDIWQRSE